MKGMFSGYEVQDHTLGKMDGRLKLALTAVLLGLALSSKGPILPLSLMASAVVVCLCLGVPGRLFFLRLSEPLLVVLVLLLVKCLTSGKSVFFCLDLGSFRIAGYREGLMEGLAMAARIVGALSVVSLLGLTTPFTRIVSALSWFRIPGGIVETLMFAYRYLFMLSDEATVIYCAQKNRLGYSNLRRGLASFGMLAGSLTLKALEHSQTTAAAMAQRGYDGTLPRSGHKAPGAGEAIASLLVIAAAVLLWMI